MSLRSLAVGSRFELTTDPVTRQQLVRYAGASDDYNPIHYDEQYAADAGLGGVIAHGMLTMAFMARAASDWAGPAGQVRRIAQPLTPPLPSPPAPVPGAPGHRRRRL